MAEFERSVEFSGSYNCNGKTDKTLFPLWDKRTHNTLIVGIDYTREITALLPDKYIRSIGEEDVQQSRLQQHDVHQTKAMSEKWA